MLLLEIVVTRLFSVLFFYHFSFFAISLVMSGLVIGGLLAARWDAHGMAEATFARRLGVLACLFSGATAAALLGLSVFARPDVAAMPSLPAVAAHALFFLPGLVAAGAFLALAFARNEAWIGTLYAWDLIAAAAACLAAIALLRVLQGPAVLLAPVLLAGAAAVLVGATRLARGAGLVLAVLAAGLAIASAAGDGRLLGLRTSGGAQPILERWNEHSRVQVFNVVRGRYLIIDRGAATLMPPIPPRADGRPVEPDPTWAAGAQYEVYRVGRPVRDVAIIGVGGGQDLLPPLFHGAQSVDGYELNGILVDLLEREYADFNAIASRPEVRLVHEEARVAITHSGKRYDVIQASLIDTWAATASGGFVLSENGLYTREAWRTFIDHLSDTGILTMTRWHIPDAPAETHRLVALASAALEDAGFADAAGHIILTRSSRRQVAVAFTKRETSMAATILVSKSPFTPEEVQRLRQAAAAWGTEVMAAPGTAPSDPVVGQLMASATRQRAIDASRFDISPPTDGKPYFFLQVRPADLLNLSRRDFGEVTQITFNGVRVLMVLAACALGLVALVAVLTVSSLPGSTTSPEQRGTYRAMTLYFLGIGLGYILVQLAMHQRLIIVLGHPTLALSVVLFCMLLGTGIGSACSARLFPEGHLHRPALVILATLVSLWLALPLVPLLERLDSSAARLSTIGAVVFAVGFVLGFPFPLGVRRVSGTGEWAIQRMWAVNGAASIAGSVLAALLGLTLGTRGVLGFGVLAYGVAMAAGLWPPAPESGRQSCNPGLSPSN
jgi:hypothetical protein